jgi:hypothetical protein
MDLAQSIHARRVSFEKRIAEQARQLEERKKNPPPKPEARSVPDGPDWLDEQLKALPREVFSRPQWKLLAKEICQKYRLSLEEVTSDARHAHLVKVRQEIWYRIRVDLGMSYPEIGKRFNKDHTTILHGVRRHAARLNLELSE